MKVKLFRLLPDYFLNDVGQLNSYGNALLLSIWGAVFLVGGLVVGSIFYRKARLAIKELENENSKGFNRLEIYRATVEKQSNSAIWNR